MERKSIILIAIVAIIIVTPIIIFPNIQDTLCISHFSSFWLVFISLSNLIIIGTLTYSIHFYNKQRNLEKEKIEKILERPLIVFSKTKSKEFYSIKNIGKGAALNIKVKSHFNEQNSIWDNEHLCYSLANNEELEMSWTTNCNAINATFSDIFDNKYHSFMDNDEIRIFNPQIEQEKQKYINDFNKIQFGAKKTTWFN